MGLERGILNVYYDGETKFCSEDIDNDIPSRVPGVVVIVLVFLA